MRKKEGTIQFIIKLGRLDSQSLDGWREKKNRGDGREKKYV